MIEVEKKFILTKEEETRLTNGAEFLDKKTFTDIYYDDKNHSLTTHDIWFHKRDNNFELKIPIKQTTTRMSDQYKELESDTEILNYFGANPTATMDEFLTSKNFFPFCNITTTRKKYTKDGFGIDLDTTDYGYSLAEIERMVEKESDIESTVQSIFVFAKSHGIEPSDKIWGKVIEYLWRNKRDHWQALRNANIVTFTK